MKKAKAKPKQIKAKGRNPGFSEAQITALETVLQTHPSIKTACIVNGIRPSTVHDWLNKADEGGTNAEVYSTFANRIRAAIELGKLSKVQTIQKAALRTDSPDWRAAAWLLERTHPDEFGQRDTLDVKHRGKIQHEHQAIHVHLPAAISTPRIPQINARTEPTTPP